jgi:flagellar biosynthetic protein FlhB
LALAEESDLEKTESASPRKLEQAREHGDVPRSRELATCTLLLGAGAAFWFIGGDMVAGLNDMLASGLSFDRAMAFDMQLLLTRTAASVGNLLIILRPRSGGAVKGNRQNDSGRRDCLDGNETSD